MNIIETEQVDVKKIIEDIKEQYPFVFTFLLDSIKEGKEAFLKIPCSESDYNFTIFQCFTWDGFRPLWLTLPARMDELSILLQITVSTGWKNWFIAVGYVNEPKQD